MLSKLLDSYFWFVQPSIVLSRADLILGYFFLGSLLIVTLLVIIKKSVKNEVKLKLLNRFKSLFLVVGISGLVWFALRYENTPIFGLRYWAGLFLLVGLIWGLFILKYLVFNFSKELRAFENEQLKNKYISGSKR